MTSINNTHQNPHGRPQNRGPFQRHSKKSNQGLIWSMGLIGLGLALGGGLWLWDQRGPDPVEVLNSQFLAARDGNAPSAHIYGGAMRVQGSPPAISAENLPPAACSKVGWYLAKAGTVIVNGILPPRLSSAKLTELCNQDDTATLTWVPRPGDNP